MQRCGPSIVQSFMPLVPSAQPSQQPSLRMRHAKGSSERLAHAALAISK